MLKRRVLSALCAAFAFCAASAFAAMPDGEFAELCRSGTAEQIQQALADGANPNAMNEDDVPALMQAVLNDKPGAAQALLAAGATVNVSDGVAGGTPLIWAADKNPELVRALLDKGAAIDAQDDHGTSALMEAARFGKADIVAALLAAGANPKLKNADGHDALWHAKNADKGVSMEAKDACVKLLQGGAKKPAKKQGATSSASTAASAAPRFGFDGLLLGAFIDGKWVSDEDLLENEDFHEHRIRGGETCRVYGFSAPESGVATLEPPGDDPHIRPMTARTSSGASVGTGRARLLVTGDHNAMPRTAQILPTGNATYKKIVADYLTARGLAVAKPNIVQLLRVDLDGDGTDEVLIAAQNEVSEDERFSFAPDKPLLTPMMSPTGVPLRKAGQYSVVLLRRVVEDQAKNIALAEFISKKNAPEDADPFTDSAWVHKIVAVADLNGDGVMEIVTAEAFLRGHWYRVYETKGASPRKVLENGVLGD